MVWKLLSGITAALLGASLYFAVVNKNALKTEKDLAARAEKDLASVAARQKEAEAAQESRTAQLGTLEKDLVATKEKVTKAAADAQEKDAALTLSKNTLAQLVQQVETIQKKIDELGDVNKLLAQVDSLKKDQQAAEGALANQTQQLASKKEAVTALHSEIARFRDLEARSRKGIVEPDFKARVASVFGTWGFVILDKGNSGGVFANADLEVKRGKNVVAKLRVRNVEQESAIADVVPGSVAEGEMLRSGDLVVAAAGQPTPPAGGGAAPAAPAAGGAAPAPAADGAAAAAAPAPAAPAAGAAMGGDPFGAAPMPAGGTAAPAPAPAGDPFGAAPAPAPAPAAGGVGTKENPSTADPFGPAPAKPAAGAADPFAPPPPK